MRKSAYNFFGTKTDRIRLLQNCYITYLPTERLYWRHFPTLIPTLPTTTQQRSGHSEILNSLSKNPNCSKMYFVEVLTSAASEISKKKFEGYSFRC